MAQASIKPTSLSGLVDFCNGRCRARGSLWPGLWLQRRHAWKYLVIAQASGLAVGFPPKTSCARPNVRVDAVVAENWAAEQAMALARAAVKAARDVEALNANGMVDISLDYLSEISEEDDEALADDFYDPKDILRLRLERARLSEMEKAGGVQRLEGFLEGVGADVDWLDADLMTLPNFSLSLAESSVGSGDGASSWGQLDVVDFDMGKVSEDVASNSSGLPGDDSNAEAQSKDTDTVTVKSKRRKERVLKRERALAKAGKAAEVTAASNAAAASLKSKKTNPTTDLSGDPVRMYLRDIGRSRLLSAAEEVELSQGIQDLMKLEGVKRKLKEQMGREPTTAEWGKAVGMPQRPFENRLNQGRACKDRMVNSNLRLVVSIAKKYQGRGMAFQDLVQVGSIGLIRGAEKFDHTKGFKFSTYAHWWIRQAVTRAIADQSRMIRLPVHMFEVISRINKAKKIVAQEHGRPATDKEVAELVGMTVEKLKIIIRSTKVTQSMERPVGKEGETTVGELVADSEVESPEEAISKRLFKQDLDHVMRTLTARERDVLRLRYGLEDGRMRTLEEIGHVFKVTRERIRQIETKAMRKLRQPDRNKVLLDYMEFATAARDN